ncbi:condensation domain-containing protein, partial [Streptomyces silvensis]|uniref:condensation domain-containing protein n=1 Tax=Streptomyces silvensis TaxID=1765722 RepID=UPI000AAB47D2
MIPLSYAQRRLWFIDRFEGPSATYNVPFMVRFTGALDTDALTAAVHDVVVRHESLRTLIVETPDGVPGQEAVAPEGLRLDVPLVEVAAEDLRAAAEQVAHRPLILTEDLPLRATLFRTGAQEHHLLLLIHHIAADGESVGPLARDLLACYTARSEGAEPELPELPVQYADYTLWQREMLGDENDPESLLSEQLGYWHDELAGVPQPLRLSTDRPRPPVASHRGGGLRFAVEPGLLSRVEEVARAADVTLPMAFQAALVVTLQHLGAGEDIAIGSTIAG